METGARDDDGTVGSVGTPAHRVPRLSGIVPATVVTAESAVDLEPDHEHAVERAVVTGADRARRDEFLTGHRLARAALAGLGHPPVAIGRDRDRVPRWPAGVVGGITHCAGYRAAAVARRRDVVAVGIDAEPCADLTRELAALVLTPAEVTRVRDLAGRHSGAAWTTLTFSAKEAVYKAWFPLTRRWLDFHDVEVTFDPARSTFTAIVATADHPVTRLTGRHLVDADLIVTAVVVRAGDASPVSDVGA